MPEIGTQYGKAQHRARQIGKKQLRYDKSTQTRSRNAIIKARVPHNMSIVNIGLGLPKKMAMVLKYVEPVLINAAAGVYSTYQYSLNSLYDPNYTGTGHQPMYFDQIMALYDHYCVIKSKFVFKAFANPGGAQCCIQYFINDDTSVTPVNFDGAAEQSLAKMTLTTPLNTKPVTLSGSWSAKAFFGGDVLANVDLQGTSSSNPTEQSYVTIGLQSLDKASTVALQGVIEIHYTAIFKELKDESQS